MPPFDPKRRKGEMVTTTGVRVRVKEPPPPEPEAPEIPAPAEKVVVRPPEKAAREHDAQMKRLIEENQGFVLAMLRRRTDVLPESANDLAQNVIVRFSNHVAMKGLPDDVRRYLLDTIQNEVRNHKQSRAREARRRDEAGLVPWAAPDPQQEAERAEEEEKLERYLLELSRSEAAVFRCIERQGMTLEETAAALGLPEGTVATQIVRARNKLKQMALDSTRATELGKRRREP